jgi:hypothetical protein
MVKLCSCSILCAGEDPPPSAMLTRDASGKSRPMRARFRTGTRKLRGAEEGILLYGEENVLIVREYASANHC